MLGSMFACGRWVTIELNSRLLLVSVCLACDDPWRLHSAADLPISIWLETDSSAKDPNCVWTIFRRRSSRTEKIAPDSSGEIGRLNDQVVANGMLGEFVDRVFDGSAEAVVQSLFNASDLDVDAINASANCSINITVMKVGFYGCVLTGRSWIGSS